MHSMSLKVFTDFHNSTASMCILRRVRCDSSDSEFGSRRVLLGLRNCGKSCRIVACASERNSNGGGTSSSPSPSTRFGSVLSRSETYALLKQQLDVAAKSEVMVIF